MENSMTFLIHSCNTCISILYILSKLIPIYTHIHIIYALLFTIPYKISLFLHFLYFVWLIPLISSIFPIARDITARLETGDYLWCLIYPNCLWFAPICPPGSLAMGPPGGHVPRVAVSFTLQSCFFSNLLCGPVAITRSRWEPRDYDNLIATKSLKNK